MRFSYVILGQGININVLEAYCSDPTVSLLFSQMHNAAAGPSACPHVPCAPAAHHLKGTGTGPHQV